MTQSTAHCLTLAWRRCERFRRRRRGSWRRKIWWKTRPVSTRGTTWRHTLPPPQNCWRHWYLCRRHQHKCSCRTPARSALYKILTTAVGDSHIRHSAERVSIFGSDLVMGHFFKTQPNPKFLDPTQPTKVFTRPNPTHHRHLVWHIRLYRKLYTTTVTRHRQVHSSQTLHSTSQQSMKVIIQLQYPLTDSRVFHDVKNITQSSLHPTQPNPLKIKKKHWPNPWMDPTNSDLATARIIIPYLFCYVIMRNCTY